MTTNTFALNKELRPLLEATAAQKGVPLWVELIPFGEQITGRDGRSWVNDHPQGMVDAFQANHADLPIDIEHAMTLSLALCTALGLSAQATEAQAVSAIHQMKTDKDKALNSTHNPSLEKFVPRADHDAALNRAQAAEIRLKEIEHRALHQHIEDELEKAQKVGAITPATVEYHRACCHQDGGLKRFQEFVQFAPRMGEDTNWDKKALNKHSQGLSEEDKVACSSLGLDKEDYLKAKEAA